MSSCPETPELEGHADVVTVTFGLKKSNMVLGRVAFGNSGTVSTISISSSRFLFLDELARVRLTRFEYVFMDVDLVPRVNTAHKQKRERRYVDCGYMEDIVMSV